MKTVFADTSYYLALLNPDDEYAEAAREYTGAFGGHQVTTAWVLTEVANSLSDVRNRQLAIDLIADLRGDGRVDVLPPTLEFFDSGLSLYTKRHDKDWSLTDCISFVVMQERGLTEALTGDHHFEQAGFVALLK